VARIDAGSVRASVESTAELAPQLAEYREPADRRVVLEAETTLGTAEIELPLAIEAGSQGGTRATGTAYHLDLEIASHGAEADIAWRLHPGGSDARSRLVVLNLLNVLHGSGPLVVRDPEFGAIQLLRLAAKAPPEALVAENHFYRAIVLVEEWSGYRLRLPERIPHQDAERLWETSWTVHARGAAVQFISGIAASAPADIDWRQTTEVGFLDPYTERFFGTDVLLGGLDYHVPVRPLAAGRESADRLRVTYRPLTELVEARLQPPRPDSEDRVQRIENGEIPRPEPVRADPERLATARELLAELRQDVPSDTDLRRALQREWPLR
jgi:hypothetical protein